MEIRNLALGATLAAATTFTCAANADDADYGFYVGTGVGLYNVEFDDIDFDEGSTAIRLFGGYKLNKFVAFEAGYVSYMEASDDILGVDVDIDGKAFDVNVRPMYPLGDRLNAFAVIGWTDYEFDVTATVPGASVSDDDSDSDLYYGFGGEFAATENLRVRGEWTTVDVDDADWGMFSVSATLRFQ